MKINLSVFDAMLATGDPDPHAMLPPRIDPFGVRSFHAPEPAHYDSLQDAIASLQSRAAEAGVLDDTFLTLAIAVEQALESKKV